MSYIVAWCGFVGAWSLFAGPVYQASLELREQDNVRGEITQALQAVPAPPPVSAWWWLLPPVRFVLERQRWQGQRQITMSALSPAQRKALVQYMNKTTGWLFVALGGFLLAVKETWELSELYDWPVWLFATLAVVIGILCLLFTAAQTAMSDRILATEPPGSTHP